MRDVRNTALIKIWITRPKMKH